MAEQLSISEIIDLWPRQEDLAADCGVERVAVTRWKGRGSIPSKHLAAVLASARKRDVSISADEILGAMHKPPAEAAE